ncbi:hypothetical protein [Micrococcus sp.]|uniref:hypothetical protein n=1 Tax=Micrococcus sp. TaxID=1271 RepID=UPI002A911404|nr:hypothetical protein [Micrococcus sp.]MDY6054342.1 hypothetical protein [Micrococcus sp.]
MSEPSTEIASAQDFDLDAWLAGATRPTREVVVYRDGHLLAELDALARQIGHLEKVGVDAEPSLAEKGEVAKLRDEYEALAGKYVAGQLVLRVQSGTVEEERKIRGDRDVKTHAEEIGRDYVYAALVQPRMSRDQFDQLVHAIGWHQWSKLQQAYQRASLGDVEPSADFLPRSSTRDAGD